MKIITVTDAWHPQVNGVVRTIEATNRTLKTMGIEVAVIGPDQFASLPCPGYREIRLSLLPYGRLADLLDRHFTWDRIALHIATEGPLGHAARRYCISRGLPFTTAYHTRFPQYLRALFGLREEWTYRFLHRFHDASDVVLAPTRSVKSELQSRGFRNVAVWTRGVDLETFRPREENSLEGLPRPLFLYVGRVSVEKNITSFLKLDLPGTKVVAGTGPALATLRQRFPEVHFVGVLQGDELARLYSSADALVFPSLTDTFGLVMLEALACGTPVAAFPVQGPLDVLGGAAVGVLDEDLQRAALLALRVDRSTCRKFAERYSWRFATEQFIRLQQTASTLAAGLSPRRA